MRRSCAATILALGLLAACQPPQARYREELEQAPPSAEHGVHSQRLEEVMQGLARLRDERLPRNMDAEAIQERRARDVATVARAMVASAEQIPGAVPEGELSPAERREFDELARTLQAQAQELADRAHLLTVPEMREQARAIEATCEQCHERYRVPSP